MRIIIDFGNEKLVIPIDSSVQLDNPNSTHYDDGIQAWLKGEYQMFPFQEENIRKQ